jgi:hypothetical protein
VYLGVDNDPAELGDVLRFLAAELGLPQPPSFAGSVSEAGDTSSAGGDLSKGGGDISRGAGEPARGGNKRCSNALLRSTGFEFSYPTFREGYRDILSGVGVRHP